MAMWLAESEAMGGLDALLEQTQGITVRHSISPNRPTKAKLGPSKAKARKTKTRKATQSKKKKKGKAAQEKAVHHDEAGTTAPKPSAKEKRKKRARSDEPHGECPPQPPSVPSASSDPRPARAPRGEANNNTAAVSVSVRVDTQEGNARPLTRDERSSASRRKTVQRKRELMSQLQLSAVSNEECFAALSTKELEAFIPHKSDGSDAEARKQLRSLLSLMKSRRASGAKHDHDASSTQSKARSSASASRVLRRWENTARQRTSKHKVYIMALRAAQYLVTETRLDKQAVLEAELSLAQQGGTDTVFAETVHVGTRAEKILCNIPLMAILTVPLQRAALLLAIQRGMKFRLFDMLKVGFAGLRTRPVFEEALVVACKHKQADSLSTLLNVKEEGYLRVKWHDKDDWCKGLSTAAVVCATRDGGWLNGLRMLLRHSKVLLQKVGSLEARLLQWKQWWTPVLRSKDALYTCKSEISLFEHAMRLHFDTVDKSAKLLQATTTIFQSCFRQEDAQRPAKAHAEVTSITVGEPHSTSRPNKRQRTSDCEEEMEF